MLVWSVIVASTFFWSQRFSNFNELPISELCVVSLNPSCSFTVGSETTKNNCSQACIVICSNPVSFSLCQSFGTSRLSDNKSWEKSGMSEDGGEREREREGREWKLWNWLIFNRDFYLTDLVPWSAFSLLETCMRGRLTFEVAAGHKQGGKQINSALKRSLTSNETFQRFQRFPVRKEWLI